MTSKTQLPKKIFENINQRLRSDEDIDLVRLTNQGHQGIAFKVLVDGQSFLIKRTTVSYTHLTLPTSDLV